MSKSTSSVPGASPAHLASLRQTELLDTPPEPSFDRITSLVCRLVHSQTALFSLVDADRQFFKSACGLPAAAAAAGIRQTPLSHSFCQYVVSSKKPFIVVDARKMPLLADNGAVRDLGVISYLGAPVRAPDGEVIGSLCAINTEPREWSDEDLADLLDLASIVEDNLAMREYARRANHLAAENGILAREYHHRIKNTLAVSASLVRLSGNDATSVANLVATITGRLNSLAAAHDALINGTNDVDLQTLATRLLQPYGKSDVAGPAIVLQAEQVTPVCLFIHELATNSAKYGAFKNAGKTTLDWHLADNRLTLQWREQVEKDRAPNASGFGSRLLQMAAAQLRGEIATHWSDDSLTVDLTLPWHADR